MYILWLDSKPVLEVTKSRSLLEHLTWDQVPPMRSRAPNFRQCRRAPLPVGVDLTLHWGTWLELDRQVLKSWWPILPCRSKLLPSGWSRHDLIVLENTRSVVARNLDPRSSGSRATTLYGPGTMIGDVRPSPITPHRQDPPFWVKQYFGPPLLDYLQLD